MEKITGPTLSNQKFAWVLEMIIAILLSILGTGVGMYVTFYQDTVTKEELNLLFPYPRDEPIIKKHIADSEGTLKALTKSLDLTNIRLEAINYEHSLKIDRLERELIRQQKTRQSSLPLEDTPDS